MCALLSTRPLATPYTHIHVYSPHPSPPTFCLGDDAFTHPDQRATRRIGERASTADAIVGKRK